MERDQRTLKGMRYLDVILEGEWTGKWLFQSELRAAVRLTDPHYVHRSYSRP